MSDITLKRLFIFVILVLLSYLPAKEPGGKFSKSTEYIVFPQAALFNVNNIGYWQYYNGQSAVNPKGDNGSLFPRDGRVIIYRDGVLWGARIQDEIKLGGQLYKTATRARFDRLYCIRRDWRSLTRDQMEDNVAALFQVPLSDVTDEMVGQVLDQYRQDWKEWPVEQGAPYVDVDGDGTYNPVRDDDGLPDPSKGDYPGIFGADQVVWYLADDSDSGLTYLFGSSPMGIEFDVTVWAYRSDLSRQSNVIYKKYRFKNVSRDSFEDMYVAQWVDPDIGDYNNDLVGCDSLTNSAFAYNAGNRDKKFGEIGLAPAAVGYTLLQGPVVPSPGDEAYFDGRILTGYRNLSMTSFTYDPSGVEEEFGNTDSRAYTLKWYNRLQGFLPYADPDNPQPYVHRASGIPTKYPLNGDPVTGTGDVDGQGANFAPSDRRMLLSAGPFTLKPGEVQEMVVAIVAGLGGSALQSLEEVRETISLLGDWRGRTFRHPSLRAEVTYEDDTRSRLIFSADLSGLAPLDSCRFVFASEGVGGDTVSVRLYDDGIHETGLAGDNVFGNSLVLTNRALPQNGYFLVYAGGGVAKIRNIGQAFHARPVPRLENIHLVWENGRQDGQPNPGENVAIGFSVRNPDAVNDITSLEVLLSGKTVLKSSLTKSGSLALDNPAHSIHVPVDTDTLNLDFSLIFDGINITSPGHMVIEKREQAETWQDTIAVIPVKGKGSYLKVRVADPARFTGHTYSVSIKKNANTGGFFWRITDETRGEIKQDSIPFSDAYDFPHPVVDGLLYEYNNPRPGIREKNSYDYEGNRWVSGYDWGGRFFFAGMDIGANYFGSTITDPGEYHNIRMYWAGDTIHFPTSVSTGELVAAARAQFPDRWSRGRTYRKDLGYGAAGIGDLPFAVYDMDQDPPRRLNVCFVEDAVNGNANLLWDMAWDGQAFADKGGNEVLFFMASDYDEGQSYGDDPWGLSADVMYVLWPERRGDRGYLLDPFTMDIHKSNPNSMGDSLIVEAPASEDDVASNVPSDYYLRQNYPNPFNPSTTIYFGLSQDINVKLEVYNILGQKVRTLKNGFMPGGRHKVLWDGRNDSGQKVSSGVYIYNLSIYYPHSRAPFIQSRKMILLK